MKATKLCIVKQISIASQLARTAKMKDASGVLIRKCEILRVDMRVILKWITQEKMREC
jgi:hypothetical protein